MWERRVRGVLACAVALVAGCGSPQRSVLPVRAPASASAVRPDGLACVAEELALQLPFAAGTSWPVIQGNDGTFSHHGRYRFAWDFDMPENTVVTAAADGVVVEVVDEFTAGDVDDALADRANRVIVDHGDASLSVYQHLRHGGALVREGDRVVRGQPVGRSGNTGYSSQPHLHFAVTDYRNRSQPVCFIDVPGGVPAMGDSYVRASAIPPAKAPRPSPSVLPLAAFADNGIELTGAIPAHRVVKPFAVTGRTRRTWPAGTRVVAYFTAREDGEHLCPFFGDIRPDRSFEIRVAPDALGTLAGILDFAIAIEQPDGSYSSDFSVPMVVRRAGALTPTRDCP